MNTIRLYFFPRIRSNSGFSGAVGSYVFVHLSTKVFDPQPSIMTSIGNTCLVLERLITFCWNTDSNVGQIIYGLDN